MRPKRLSPPVRRTARRWRTPPAITHGAEPFEGLTVLDEVKGPLGFLLWQAARDVNLWAAATPEERPGLFVPGADASLQALIRAAGVEVQLESPLMTIVRMAGAPDVARPESVELACQHIAYWADQHGYLATAICFGQAAALSVPMDAGAAYAVGRMARRRAEYARAETWFRRAIALARQTGDWQSYALAFSGLGNLYMHRGNLPAARRFFIRALRAAGRNSLHDIEGMALHDLFAIAGDYGELEEANALARRAFEAYGPLHPNLKRLAHDVAYFWCTQGCFAPALHVLQSVLRHFEEPADRLSVLGDIGRAAGGAGDHATYQRAWDEAMEIIASNGGQDTTARAYLDLAHGALSLGAWERAEDAAQRALEGATRRGEAKTRLTAEAVMEAARRHQHAERAAAAGHEAWRDAADALATDFVESLRG